MTSSEKPESTSPLENQGNLYKYINNAIQQKNSLIKQYIFSDDEKNQYCNCNQFKYDDIIYDFKMYTLDIPLWRYNNLYFLFNFIRK